MRATVRASLSAILLGALALSPSGGATAATGDPVATTIDVSLPRATDTVVDPERHRAYLSSRAESRVMVVDLESGESTALPRLPGASELALDTSGDHLWVSLQTEGELARVSTSPPYEVTYFPLGGDLTCPGELVAVAGKVYVLTDSCDGQFGQFWILDPATGGVQPSEAMSYPSIYGASVTRVPGTTLLVWQEHGLSRNGAGVIDAATDELVARVDDAYVIGTTPDSSGLLDASGDVLSLQTMAPVGTWVPPSVDGARLEDSAVSGTGLLAVPATSGLVVYDLAAERVVRTWRTADDTTTVRQALWDGSAVVGVTGVDRVALMRVADPLAAPTSLLEVEDPGPDETVGWGGSWTARGRLTDGSGVGVAGAPIEVRSPEGLIATTSTTADGTWSVVLVVDSFRVQVVFPGDPTHESTAVSMPTPYSSKRFVSVEGPTTAAPSEVLHYVGSVVWVDGRPAPDEDVTVEWECGEQSFSGVVLTDDDGVFRYDTPVPRCRELAVTFVSYPYSQTTATTDLTWRVPTLTASGPERLVPGESGTWSAALLIDGQPVAGRALTYTAWEGGNAERGTLTTDDAGRVTLTTGSIGEGTTTVQFRFAGDATTLGATAEVATRVAGWPSELTVDVATPQPVAGAPVVLTGTLALGDASTPEGRVVTLARNSEQLDSTTVAADGSFELTTVPAFATAPGTMNYVVRFAGDWRHGQDDVLVRVVVEQQPTTLTSRVAASLSDDGRARVVAAADPGYAGMCVTHRLDRRTSDGWRTLRTTGCRITDDGGRSSFRTPVLQPDATYRVRAAFAGDDRTAADRGAWKRFTAR
jgi:hypothetical protein